MKLTNNQSRATSRNVRERNKNLLSMGLLGALILSSMGVVIGQVYGVRRNTAVVHGPNNTVVASKTTVVAGGGALPRGYIAALPGGYRAVTVSGTRYYTVGGVYYRPQMYQGRTVYVVAHP